jgi:hypothetical protein
MEAEAVGGYNVQVYLQLKLSAIVVSLIKNYIYYLADPL